MEKKRRSGNSSNRQVASGNVPVDRRRGAPRKLNSVLADLITHRGYAQQQTNEELAQAWNQTVGQGLAESSRVGQLRRGILEILVSNSVVLQELQFGKPTFLADMNRLLPQHDLKELRFRVA